MRSGCNCVCFDSEKWLKEYHFCLWIVGEILSALLVKNVSFVCSFLVNGRWKKCTDWLSLRQWKKCRDWLSLRRWKKCTDWLNLRFPVYIYFLMAVVQTYSYLLEKCLPWFLFSIFKAFPLSAFCVCQSSCPLFCL